MGLNDLLLAIDVGNTETKIGVFSDGAIVRTWRLRTAVERTADEYAIMFAQLFTLARLSVEAVGGIVVASVVPRLNRPLMQGCTTCFGVRATLFRPAEQRLMRITTERPGEVGADLIAAAVAARARRGSPVIVVTFGTATTIAAVDADGSYRGVAVAPGIQVGLDALIGRAAKLPQIALSPPTAAIGRSTVASVQSGVLFGAVALTEGMVARFRRELGVDAPVVASGGFAEVVASACPVIDEAVPTLVLEGLALYAAFDLDARGARA